MSKQEFKANQPAPRGPGGGPGSNAANRHGYRKPKNAAKTVFRMFKYFKKNIPLLVLALLMVVFSSLAGVAGNYLLKPIINTLGSDIKLIAGDNLTSEGLEAAKEQILHSIVFSLIIMGVIYAMGAIFSYLSSRIMVSIAQRTTNTIRAELFSKLQKLPISYFDKTPNGDIMSSFTNDMDNVGMALEQSLSQTITSLFTVVATFIMMLVLSPLLTVIVVLILFLMLKIVKTVGLKSANYFRNQQKYLGNVDGYIEEMVEGQKVIKVFNHEDETCKEFAKRNEELKKAGINAQTFAGIMMPIMGNLSYFHYAITAAVGAVMIVNPGNWRLFASMDIGTLASFLQFTRSFSHPITQISNQINVLLSALAGAERIFEIIDVEPEANTGKVRLVESEAGENGVKALAWKTPDGNIIELKGDVRFNNVTFAYIEGQNVLHNVSIYAKPGQKIAFVGSTGAGKTTITNLINRFYEIQEGVITYDGIDIRDIDKNDLRRTMGIVLQDVHLFKGTIRDNIRYGKLDATEEEIVRAAKIANAHSFISRLPNGYDTMLTADGTNLSQGQRQLISIARAAVADPPVLILDEATSSIDTRTERLIEKGMDQLMSGRTTFVIAHRLSTVRNSNAIMVLEKGEIIERGDHEELLDYKGKYYSLYTGKTELS
ncbi:MAG: ABC transporter ATP-binding protein [Ruminococcaceae bacterium]|nr:ABC transporter ATP-binding protein [Oscillospiraceae bacterium]